MDMESDMSDGDMGMLGFFRPTIIIPPPLARPFEPETALKERAKKVLRAKIEKGGRERSRRK